MTCLVCLGKTRGPDYHERCLRATFGTRLAPTIDLDLARFQAVALATVGRTTISGVQRKISVGIRAERQTLAVVSDGAQYILKPPSSEYPGLPANEHLTMRLAERFGLIAPSNGLLRMRDGELAFAVRRFDRPEGGPKRRQEDYCQLAGKPAKAKYEGSAELLVRLTRRYSSEPFADVARLFESLVFAWWTGNDDAHLKNFSLLEDAAGRHLLSPVYDQVNTRLYYPEGEFALSVMGKRRRLIGSVWRRLLEYAQLPLAFGQTTLDRPTKMLNGAIELIGNSTLTQDMQSRYIESLERGAEGLSR